MDVKRENEYRTVVTTFRLDGDTLIYLKANRIIEAHVTKTRVGKTVISVNRIKWMLQHNQPVPEHSFIGVVKGVLTCYHRMPSIFDKCKCGHNRVIKEYITDICMCANCFSERQVTKAFPEDRCPVCNGNMIIRHAKFGVFLGCSNFTHRLLSCKNMALLDNKHCLFPYNKDL